MSEVRLEERPGGLCDLVLDRPKINALGPSTLEALHAALLRLQRAPGLRGVFLRAEGRVFSGGLDPEALLHCPNETDGQELARLLEAVLLEAYALPVPMVTAIHGTAVGAGLALALCADRIILSASPFLIGFNELQLGIPWSRAALEIVAASLPMALSRRMVLDAELLQAEEAFVLGFGHQRVEDATRSARAWLDKVAQRPLPAFTAAKTQLRAPAIQRARLGAEEARAAFARTLQSAPTRAALEAARGR